MKKDKSFPQAARVDAHVGAHVDAQTRKVGAQTGPVDAHVGAQTQVFHRDQQGPKKEEKATWPSRLEKERPHVRLDANRLQALKKLCKAQGVALSTVFDAFMVQYLENYTADSLARGLRIEDLKNRRIEDLCGSLKNNIVANGVGPREKPSLVQQNEANEEHRRAREILQFYSSLSGNRIRKKDRQTVRAIFDLPDVVIFTGIMRAVWGCADRVGSFAYCVRAMRDVAGLDDIDAEFMRLREKLLLVAKARQMNLPMQTEKLLFGNFQQRRDENK